MVQNAPCQLVQKPEEVPGGDSLPAFGSVSVEAIGIPIPVTQSRGNLLLNLVANKSILGRCHLLHRVEDLWKEKPLFGWSGLAWIACLLPH